MVYFRAARLMTGGEERRDKAKDQVMDDDSKGCIHERSVLSAD